MRQLLLISLLFSLQAQGQVRTEIGDHFDRDGDGWCDLWVSLFDFKSRSRQRDADKDGVTDYDEMLRFTDPNMKTVDPATLSIQSQSLKGLPNVGETLFFPFPTIPGHEYIVERTTDLVNWIDWGFPFVESGEKSFGIEVSITQEQEFFRLRHLGEKAMRLGFDEFTLPAEHEYNTDAVPLNFGGDIKFYDDLTDEVYVNTNGCITLLFPEWGWVDQGLFRYSFPIDFGWYGTSDRTKTPPRIAPFWADVDNRLDPSEITYGPGEVDGRKAFGVSWRQVGYFDSHTDRLNSFQLILIERFDTGPGNFDLEFNYNQIQWDSGDDHNGVQGVYTWTPELQGNGRLIAVAGMGPGLPDGGRHQLQYFRSGITIEQTNLGYTAMQSPQLDRHPFTWEPNTVTGLIYNSRPLGAVPIPGRYRFEFREGRAHQRVNADAGPYPTNKTIKLSEGGTLQMEGTAENPDGGEANAYWYLDHIISEGGPLGADSVTIIEDPDTPTSTFQFTETGVYLLRIQGYDAGGKTFVESWRQWAGYDEQQAWITVVP